MDVAATRREAVHALDRYAFAWIVLDLALPDGDGTEVLELVRQRGLASGVVIVTGVVDHARFERVRALAPDALLRKPVDFERLLAIIGA